MANEINIALNEVSLVDLVARIYDPGFTQVGADVAMTEVVAGEGRYTGSAPAATLATQEYEILFYRTTPAPDQLVGRGTLLWDVDGDKELPNEEAQLEVWKDRGLDPDDDKLITENAVGTDYDEDMTGIHKGVTKAGSITTISRA